MTTHSLGPLNRATYRAAHLAGLMFRSELAAALQGLPRKPASRAVPRPRDARQSTLIPISPQLLPRPADWPGSVILTGHWMGKPLSARLDAELEAFTNAGPFIYAGFGSMKAGNAGARGQAIVAAARRRGLRVLVAEGWGGIEVAQAFRGDDVLVREAVDHHLVLPRAVAAIHHGGAGTVHAAALAGIPSVVAPFIADQPFWGHLLNRAGLAPEPLPYRKITTDRLVRALAQTEALRDGAARMGERIRGEDGTAAAITALENLAAP